MIPGRDPLIVVVVIMVVASLATKPRNVPEWASASAAAAILLIGGAVRPGEVPDIGRDVADVLLFLSSMLVIGHLAAEAGVFAWAGLRVVAWSRGSGRRLFVLLYLLGAALTTCFSLDVSVVVLTPLVLAIAHRAGLPPVPFLFLCPFAANIPSLLLPIANLTNLIVVDGLEIDLLTYVAVMAGPALVATGVSLWLLVVQFRTQIPVTVDHVDAEVRPLDRAGRANAIGVVLVLAGLFGAGVADRTLWWVTLPAAVAFMAIAAVARTFRVVPAIRAASPGLLLFVFAMGIVVRAASEVLLGHLAIATDTSPVAAAVAGSGAAAILSNVVNNVPVALGTVAVADTLPSPLDRGLGFGALVGANIGPAMTTYGSLATLIWLTAVRAAGHEVRPMEYMRVSVRVTLPTLVVTTVALAVAVRFLP